MIEIQAEGAKIYYVPATDADRIELPEWAGPRSMLAGADTRLSFFRNYLSVGPEFLPFWLVWQEAIALDDLDQRVAIGQYSDSDFYYSFQAYFSKTYCLKCGSIYASLVVDAGNIYPGAPGLLQEKIRNRFKPVVCPTCGTGFRILVAKILEKVGVGVEPNRVVKVVTKPSDLNLGEVEYPRYRDGC